MSRIHYFQRYSQRENVVTNNTLLLLGRLYEASPHLLQRVLEAWLEQDADALAIGPRFAQQTRHSPRGGEGGRIPDGRIVQKAFEVVVEVKRGGEFNAAQLQGQIGEFSSSGGQRVLLLRPVRLSASERAVIATPCEEAGVQFVDATFSDLVTAAGEVARKLEPKLLELVTDFEAFCAEEGLLATDRHRMRIVPCGTTLKDNLALGLYYHPATRGYSPHAYVGLYADRVVQAIGRVETVVEAVLKEDGTLHTTVPVSPEAEDRIRKAMARARAHGYRIEQGHVFFLFEPLVETIYKKSKTSKGGMMGTRFIDLKAVTGYVGDPPATEDLAVALRNLTWE